ncbi:MAG: hypothetical protein KAY37_06805 [Phycisphaerae bacterium]|nr:hypothetical protein [Phycisphaerae bacterium]
MSDAAPEPEAARALDRDLYCLTCGYNLRGLSGDPLRCPECGHLNPVGDVEIPAEIITQRLRKMETSPALCVGAMLFGVPLQVAFWSELWIELHSRWFALDSLVSLGIPAFGLVFVWVLFAARFRSSCLGKPGWVGALAKYHFYGLLFGGLTLGVMVFGAGNPWWGRGPNTNSLDYLVGMLLLFIAVILAVHTGVKALHRRLTASMRILQREVAVTIAREETRKRMARQRRGLFG